MVNLKTLLLNIRENNWVIPENINLNTFSYELLENIGTLDSELRDDLILNILWFLITQNKLMNDTINKLLSMCLSEDYLFYLIKSDNRDAIFKRSFTVLVIRSILLNHLKNNETIFDRKTIKTIYDSIIEYLKLEKDYRGYDNKNGWAHSIAHSGDLLRTIAQCKEIEKVELLGILDIIKAKFCIDEYVFINEEAERIVSAIVSILLRNELQVNEFNEWINSFINIKTPEKYPEKHYFKENVKNLLRSLYFRLKHKNIYPDTLPSINKVLDDLNEVFNSLNY